MKTIAITTFKGGTGKTTTTINLAAALARKSKVLALDLDRTNFDLSKRAETLDSFEIRATTAGRVGGIVSRGKYDFVLVDCPPSLAKETKMALSCADLVVVPVKCEMMDVESIERIMHVVAALRDPQRGAINPNLQVKILLTMRDVRDSSQNAIAEKLQSIFIDQIWCDAVPRSHHVNDANNERLAVVDTAPRCEAAKIYNSLAKYIAMTSPTPTQ
jgi:chromosome partitioning protein